jgi:Tfp pilus assembly protein PilE
MTTHPKPPIFYGAALLATLSLIWSGYAITDLMRSGPFGLSVALAGDIGWLTVLWAEARGIAIGGKPWAPHAAGWIIALAVAGLLVLHGLDAQSTGQTVAGPFVVLVGKIVWAFALAAMADPAAPTPEQQAEVHAVMRDTAHQTALHYARAEAEIARIRDEARVTLARDETDFEIGLERLAKRAELARRTPLALTAGPDPEPPTDQNAEQANTTANTIASSPNHVREQIANSAATSTNPDHGRPSIADLVREQVASKASNADAVRGVMAARPDANRDSVAAAVRRERRRLQPKDGYT